MVGSVCLDVRLHAVMACCLCAHVLPQILNIEAGYKEMLRPHQKSRLAAWGPQWSAGALFRCTRSSWHVIHDQQHYERDWPWRCSAGL